MVKLINQPIVFILELVMLYSFGYFAYSKGINSFTRFAFAIAAIALGVILWSLLAAPKSGHRLPMPYLAVFRGGLFLVAAFFLYQLQMKNFALIVAILAITTQLISYLTEPD
ncbi:MAG: YrdB family protein [Niabella sp.]